MNCYKVPTRMGTTGINQRPFWCNFLLGEVSEIGNNVCAACGEDKECVNDNIMPQDCPANAFTSRPEEYQCFPVIAYGKDLTFPAFGAEDYGHDAEIDPGNIGYRGMDKTKKNDYDCPPGYYCPQPWTQNWIQCPPGSYSPDGEWICLPCPEGYHCPLRHNSAIVNKAGYFSP